MIEAKIKIALIEDNIIDAELIKDQVKKEVSSPVIEVVDTLDGIKKLMAYFNPDMVLCDYNLEGFTGLDVLVYVRSVSAYIPFIFVTGTVNNEELAAETILSGASGYFLKQNISKLHEKLLPYFQQVVSAKRTLSLDGRSQRKVGELKRYLDKVQNETIMSSFEEIQKTLRILNSFQEKS